MRQTIGHSRPRRHGGYQAVWRLPLVFRYRGHEIVSMPLPSSGGVALAEVLGILEGFDLSATAYLSPEHVHLWTWAVKRAFVERNAYLADPDFVSVPRRPPDLGRLRNHAARGD